MRLENPSWLWLLAALPLFSLVFLAGERSVARRMRRLASARLLPILDQAALWPRVLRHILILTAATALVLALAQPSYGYRIREIQGKGADILFAIDVSRSMLCSDLVPDRLTRAKLAVQDMLDAAPGNRAGLIPFSREAFLQCPLTLDRSALVQSLAATDTRSVPSLGTSLADAIAEARAAFGQSEGKKVLVILSDGEDLEGNGLKEARQSPGITIITVGCATPEGAPVPESPDKGSGYTRDAGGRPVVSRLESADLMAIAAASGGFYETVDSGALLTRFREAIDDDMAKSRETGSIREPIIRYRWPLALAIALLVAESLLPPARRRPAPSTLPAILLALFLLPAAPDSARAAPAQAPIAIETYNQGVSLYNRGDYAAAAECFERALELNGGRPGALAQRAEGNAGAAKLAKVLQTLPKDGTDYSSPENKAAAVAELENAKAHLEKALSADPGSEAVRKSYERVKALLKELNKPETRRNPPPQEDKEDSQEEQPEDESQEGDKGNESGQGAGKSGKSGQQDKQQQDGSQEPQGGNDNSDKQQPKQDSNKQKGQSGRGGNSREQDAQQQQQPQQGEQNSANRQDSGQGEEQQHEPQQGENDSDSGQQPEAGEAQRENAASKQQEKAPEPDAEKNDEGKGAGEADVEKEEAKEEREEASQGAGKADKKEANEEEQRYSGEGSEGKAEDKQEEEAASEHSRVSEARGEDRREGEDSSKLEHASEAAQNAQPGKEQPLPEQPGQMSTANAQSQTERPGPEAKGEMSREEAEQLLRLLRQDEKILPAGELVEPRKWNSSGKDW